MKILILSAPPGYGKSHLAKILANRFSGETKIVSADDFFVDQETGEYIFVRELLGDAHAHCFRSYLDFIMQDRDPADQVQIIVDNTNVNTSEISPYYLGARAFGHTDIQIVRIACDAETAYNRQIHNVPKKDHSRMANNFQRCMIPRYWKVVEMRSDGTFPERN